jgi:cell division protein FtsB
MATKRNSRNRGSKALRIIKKVLLYTLFILTILLGVYLIGRPAISFVNLGKEIDALEAKKAYYQEAIQRDSLFIESLQNDEVLEQLAREKYFMHGKNEHIFIVE